MRRRPDGLQLPGRAPVAALPCCAQRELVSAAGGGSTVDVHPRCHQRPDEVGPLRGSERGERCSEREPGNAGLPAESVTQVLQERDGVGHHRLQGDAFWLVLAPQ